MSLYWETSYWFVLDCLVYNVSLDDANNFLSFVKLLALYFPSTMYGSKYSRAIEKYDVYDSLCCHDCLNDWLKSVQKYVRGYNYKNIHAKDKYTDKKDLYTNPQYWGSYFWTVLENAAKVYSNNPTSKDKKNMKKFFEIVEHILPCEKCARHYHDFLKKNSIEKYLCCSDCMLKFVKKIKNNIKNNDENIVKHNDECIKKDKCTIQKVCNKSVCNDKKCNSDCRRCKLYRYNGR